MPTRCDELSEGFGKTRQLLVDADVTADSFGLLQESGDIAKSYEQRCTDGLDTLRHGVDVFSDLAAALRQMRDNYQTADTTSATAPGAPVTRGPSGAERIEMWLGPAEAAYSVIKPIVEFLAHPLDQVTGDPDGLREKAQAWRERRPRSSSFADDELKARTDLLSYWGARRHSRSTTEMTELNQSLREISSHFAGTAELLEGSAEGASRRRIWSSRSSRS